MKRRRTFPPLVILILTVLIATTLTSAAILPEHGPSASGAGVFRFRNSHTERLEVWSFSFEATSNKNGHTRGRAQFDNLTAQTQVVVRIKCLSVGSALNTDFAAMSGTVLHSDDPDLPKSENVVFAATDGPLLPGSSADTITPLFSFPGMDCHDGEPLTVLPVEDGDIQIQP
jgi:hypothetical protein